MGQLIRRSPSLILIAPFILLMFLWFIPLMLLYGESSKEQLANLFSRVPWAIFLAWLPCIVIAFVCVGNNGVALGSYFAIGACYSSLSAALGGLGIENGVLKFFGAYRKQASPIFILSLALVFTASCGALHYALWTVQPNEYSGIHNFQDALYFSVVTTSTVGYGDITPIGYFARWLSVIQILCAVMLLIVAASAALSVWLSSHQPAPEPADGAPHETTNS